MCCYNQKDLLGYYGQGQSILDLWRGEKAQSIRREFSNRQMAEGCSRCAQLIKQTMLKGYLQKSTIAPIALFLPLDSKMVC